MGLPGNKGDIMDDSSKPLSYIDTQGMGGPSKANYDPKKDKTVHKPATVTPRRIITPELTKELKILINEVLDEREYKRKLKGPYDLHDEIEPLGPSYFDVEHFKHFVGEDEPSYQDWSQ